MSDLSDLLFVFIRAVFISGSRTYMFVVLSVSSPPVFTIDLALFHAALLITRASRQLTLQSTFTSPTNERNDACANDRLLCWLF
jgi:hypothetical protein